MRVRDRVRVRLRVRDRDGVKVRVWVRVRGGLEPTGLLRCLAARRTSKVREPLGRELSRRTGLGIG